MDLTSSVKSAFKIETDILEAEGQKKVPEKKVITQEIIDLNLQTITGMFEETEVSAFEAGYDESDILLLYQAIQKAISDRIEKLKIGEEVLSHENSEPVTAGSASPAEEKKFTINDIYDFENMPMLTCRFQGEGPLVMADNRPLKTWKVKEEGSQKTYLIPQWTIFSEVQGSFLGFQAEQPDKYVYLLTYKGVQQLQPSGIKFMVQIMKKFPG